MGVATSATSAYLPRTERNNSRTNQVTIHRRPSIAYPRRQCNAVHRTAAPRHALTKYVYAYTTAWQISFSRRRKRHACRPPITLERRHNPRTIPRTNTPTIGPHGQAHYSLLVPTGNHRNLSNPMPIWISLDVGGALDNRMTLTFWRQGRNICRLPSKCHAL